ncbi:glycosyltransferase family 2 protein [Candidatus Gottesmanbacteria bacterium]|nr:glycosyltransferase family 2 protein [Candidatus Gottesmanbacteria bacterium]
MKYKLKFSICMPVYNGALVIKPTLRSILSQNFDNYELIIVDDCSKDDTEKVVKSFREKRIRYFKNKSNLGYSLNLEECRKKAKGDIIYLMGQDDILGKDALLNTYKAFMLSKDIGAATRPYFWFDRDINKPVRAKGQLNPQKDEVVKITDDRKKIIALFSTLDQLSGLALRREYIDVPFHKDIFPCHVYPFASIFKKHPAVFLKDYNLAVRIGSSQCRSPRMYKRKTSYIYDKSPIQSWVDMFNGVFYETKFKDFRKYMIKNFVAVNYVGLVQIRNYARYQYLLQEIWMLLKYRWQNVYSPQFWFFSLGCLLMPPVLLIPLVDWYKSRVNSLRFKKIKFKYQE